MKRTLTVGAGVLALGCAGLGWTIARRLTAPVRTRRYDLVIRDLEDDGERVIIVLDRTRQTESAGIYSLLFPDGGWLQLSDEVLDRGPDRIARVITGTARGFTPGVGTRASWSGIYFATPEDAGLAARDVVIESAAGTSPAWLVDGADEATTWAIHVHGLGSTRAGTLRGAQVASDLGCTSLIISYRNDGEGPTVGRGRSTLGFTEVVEAESAIDFALARGARRIVLVGWSMGAVISHQVIRRNRYAGTIAALVLESPVLNWPATIRTNCIRAGLPGWTGWLALPWLTANPLARILGLPSRLPLSRASAECREEAGVPTLILHGTRDDSTPASLGVKLRRHHASLVESHTFAAEHTMTWNSSPERWRKIVADWLAGRLARDGADNVTL